MYRPIKLTFDGSMNAQTGDISLWVAVGVIHSSRSKIEARLLTISVFDYQKTQNVQSPSRVG